MGLGPLFVFFVVATSASLSLVSARALRLQKRAAFYIANETACVVDNIVYYNGDPIPTDDPCEACKCRPPGFACVLRECEVKPGCRAVRRAGHCCPEYICGCEHDGRMYRDGDEIRDSQNPCYTCYCQGSAIACSFTDCFFRVDCTPEYIPGECCPVYNHCPSLGSALNNTQPQETARTAGPVAATTIRAPEGPVSVAEVTTEHISSTKELPQDVVEKKSDESEEPSERAGNTQPSDDAETTVGKESTTVSSPEPQDITKLFYAHDDEHRDAESSEENEAPHSTADDDESVEEESKDSSEEKVEEHDDSADDANSDGLHYLQGDSLDEALAKGPATVGSDAATRESSTVLSEIHDVQNPSHDSESTQNAAADDDQKVTHKKEEPEGVDALATTTESGVTETPTSVHLYGNVDSARAETGTTETSEDAKVTTEGNSNTATTKLTPLPLLLHNTEIVKADDTDSKANVTVFRDEDKSTPKSTDSVTSGQDDTSKEGLLKAVAGGQEDAGNVDDEKVPSELHSSDVEAKDEEERPHDPSSEETTDASVDGEEGKESDKESQRVGKQSHDETIASTGIQTTAQDDAAPTTAATEGKRGTESPVLYTGGELTDLTSKKPSQSTETESTNKEITETQNSADATTPSKEELRHN